MIFDGSQVLIGKGAQADVFRYQGYAYKVYRPAYPEEWILFEKQQQEAVNRAGLCPVRYYDTDDPHIIKMDLIDGEMLEKKMRGGFEEGFSMLAEAFRRVHEAPCSGIRMPRLADTAGLFLDQEERENVLPVIERLSAQAEPCICHLDLHFLNIMVPYGSGDFVIIDWMNARIAPPVFDYARSYVILKEFAAEAAGYFLDAVSADMEKAGITEADLESAVNVCTVMRKYE